MKTSNFHYFQTHSLCQSADDQTVRLVRSTPTIRTIKPTVRMSGCQFTRTHTALSADVGPIWVLSFKNLSFHLSDAYICEFLNKFWELLGPPDQSRYHPDKENWKLCLITVYMLPVGQEKFSGSLCCTVHWVLYITLNIVLYLTLSVVPYT